MRLPSVLLASVCATALVHAQDARTPIVEDSEDAACLILKNHMAKLIGLPRGKPYSGWYCDGSTLSDNHFFIMALRAKDPTRPPGEIYSGLVGWFAVARRSNVVLEYDVAEDRVVPISRAYYRSARSAAEKHELKP
jgi:hypothetical protein